MFFQKKNDLKNTFAPFNQATSSSLINFSKFIEIYFKDNQSPSLEKIYEKINEDEHASDILRRDLISNLTNIPMLPKTRGELLELLILLDEIPNACQEISRQIICEAAILPSFTSTYITNIVSITLKQHQSLLLALENLFVDYELLLKETQTLTVISNLEKEVDYVEISLIKEIFQSDLPLAEKMYFKEIINKICDISDLIEDIADSIQVMAVLRKV